MNQINIQDRNIKDKESEVSWLLWIPDELKLEVFKNLSPQDKSSVSETCVELHGIIQDPRLWTELTVDLSETRRSLIWKVTKCPWLNTLKITNKTGIQGYDPRNLKKLSNLSRRTPHLKKIHFIGFRFKVDEELLLLSCIGGEFA